jgi:hypothetical protein
MAPLSLAPPLLLSLTTTVVVVVMMLLVRRIFVVVFNYPNFKRRSVIAGLLQLPYRSVREIVIETLIVLKASRAFKGGITKPCRAALDMKSSNQSTFALCVPPPTRCGPWEMVVGPRESFHLVFVRVIVIQIWSVSLDLLVYNAQELILYPDVSVCLT